MEVIKLKRAVDFFVEWAESEPWKKKICSTILSEESVNIKDLSKEIINLYYSKEEVSIELPNDELPQEKSALFIEEIANPYNINALSLDSSFKLAKNLNVFYGENGSGKSSYVRTFRKLANNYYTQLKQLDLLPNVYTSDIPGDTPGSQQQTIDISFNDDNESKREKVDINVPHPALSKINVWDSESVIPLINNDLSFSVLPKGFDYFKEASELIDQLKENITAIIGKYEEKKKQSFADSSFELIKKEIESLLESGIKSHNLDTFLQTEYPISEDIQDLINEINVQEKELQSKGPLEKIKLLRVYKKKLNDLYQEIELVSKTLNEDTFEKINQLINEYKSKIKLEHKLNEEFKKSISVIKKINENWLHFIKSGGDYYKSINERPSKHDRCIFCAQTLSEVSADFINTNIDHIEKSLVAETESLKKQIDGFEPTYLMKNLIAEEKAIMENETLINQIESSIQIIQSNQEILKKGIKEKEFLGQVTSIDLSDLLSKISAEMETILIRIDSLKGNDSEIKKSLKTLADTKTTLMKNQKMHHSRDITHTYLNINENCEKVKTVKKKLTTGTLTRKSQEAFEHIVKDDYLVLFKQYCNELNVNNVSIQMKPSKGRNLRGKSVGSTVLKITDVMSEGEQKAVALAEFATDLNIRKNYNTVIFDDPVTSLDYKRSEKFANLIFKLSQDRQVIVFTHNIMFYYFLYNLSPKKKNDDNYKFFKVDEFDTNNKGIITPTFSGH
ncbi:AAA family ATPase [Peribacillus sp. NPDC097675]|uniref:AAA family ATPase n=1 Tax=Peribacillus sp. NPDC097675 TaxID=3390618 RepID=UPI003D082E6E